MTGRVKTYEAIVKGHNVPRPGVPESFKVLVKELQSLCLDIKVLNAAGDEIELRDDDDDEPVYNNNHGTFADDDLDLGEGDTKDVDLDEAAEAGYEIQDEDDVFGDLLSDDGDLL